MTEACLPCVPKGKARGPGLCRSVTPPQVGRSEVAHRPPGATAVAGPLAHPLVLGRRAALEYSAAAALGVGVATGPAAAAKAAEEQEWLCDSADPGFCIQDMEVGRGRAAQKGLLLLVHYVATIQGEVVDSTRARGKPIAFLSGGRPFAGVNQGMLIAVSTMREGGRRRVRVPSGLGFGATGATLVQATCDGVFCDRGPAPGPIAIPPDASLEYELELLKVTPAPGGY